MTQISSFQKSKDYVLLALLSSMIGLQLQTNSDVKYMKEQVARMEERESFQQKGYEELKADYKAIGNSMKEYSARTTILEYYIKPDEVRIKKQYRR